MNNTIWKEALNENRGNFKTIKVGSKFEIKSALDSESYDQITVTEIYYDNKWKDFIIKFNARQTHGGKIVKMQRAFKHFEKFFIEPKSNGFGNVTFKQLK